MSLPQLTQIQIEQIAHIIGDTYEGLSNTEIGHFLAQCRLRDPDAGQTKWVRLYNAFCAAVNGKNGSIEDVYRFIQYCMDPARGLNDSDRYKNMMFKLNRVLMLSGIEIRDDGKYYQVSQAKSLSEVQRRTKGLRDKLTGYSAHPEVLKCCRDELLTEDYFHAVHEASKSLCERIREMSGLSLDGAELIQKAFSVKEPYIAFNSLRTSSEQNQQNGLKEMLCGVIHMVRNVTAHELKIRWDINEKDAVDILEQISYLHKLLDVCVPVPRSTP